MKRSFFLVIAVLFLYSGTVFAKDAKKPIAQLTQPAQAQQDADKQELINNVNNMRSQEVRVVILQQLVNEEMGKLQNLQAAFCAKYKLDIEKFRKGLYRYDEKERKFIEQKVEEKNKK